MPISKVNEVFTLCELSKSNYNYGYLNSGKFWMREEYLPSVILALPRSNYPSKPAFNVKEYPYIRWIRLQHQTGGIGCFQHYFWATILNPINIYALRRLTDYWCGSDIGGYNAPTVEDINLYNTQLMHLFQVQCSSEKVEHFMQEGIYPVDCTLSNLKKLTHTKLPERDLKELIAPEYREINQFNFQAYILGENSD